MSVVDEVKARANIIEVVGRYTPLKRAGSIYKGICPFHNERTPSFVVFPHSGTWHCFGACGTGGDIFAFLMRKENLAFREVLERLAQETGVTLEPPEHEGDRSQRSAILEANEAAAACFEELLLHHPAGATARAYLERRGIDPATRERFRLGFALDQWSALRDHLLARGFSVEVQQAAGLVKRHEERESVYDAFRNRLIVPIRDRQGRVLGFGGRVLDDGVPKYLNTSETPLFHKSHVVYGIDLAWDAIQRAGHVVIVEGYMDVIAAHQHGFTNVVACMGTALTAEQLRQMQRYTSHFVLALDADAAGQAATIRGLNQARQALLRVSRPVIQPGGRIQMTERLGASLHILAMPEGMDPDDVVRRDPDLWRRLTAEAKPLVDFYFDVVSARGDLDSAEGKAAAVDELAPLIAELQDAVERDEYVQRLSRLVRVQELIIEGRVRAAVLGRAAKQGDPARAAAAFGRQPFLDPSDHPGFDAAPPADVAAPSESATPSVRPRQRIDPEDHFLAMLLREPDLLVWLSHSLEVLRVPPPSPRDLARTENQEIFVQLKRYLTSDELWDLELFQESIDAPLHATLGTLVAYGAQLPQRTDTELREGMIKDIVHLRLQRLKAESLAVKYLVDEAQRNGEADSARELGSVYGRIQRELDHLQPLKLRVNLLDGEQRRRTSGVRMHPSQGVRS